MGPNSFALDNSGAVVLQQPSVSASGPQVTLQGGGGARAEQGVASQAPGGQFQQIGQQANDLSSKTLNALDKLTQGMLQPLIVQQQRQAYFDGMSKVAQGQSLLDIEKTQPWYSKIFGPSSTVEGAQAMTAMTAVSQSQTAFMQAMPELREKDPGTVRQFLVDQASKISNTGDPATDALVQAKLAEQWGPMLKTHMQQYVQWQQEDTAKKWNNMGMAQGGLLQSYLHNQNGPIDPAQASLEVQKFTDTLVRPAGMTDDSYGKLLASQAMGQMSQGNFEAYTAMKKTPELWNSIPVQTRANLENQEELWTQRSLKFKPAMSGMLQDQTHLSLALQQGAYQGNESQLNADIDKMNTQWQSATGATTPMINNIQRDALIKQYYTGQMKMQTVYAKAAAQLKDDQMQRASVLTAFNGGMSSLMQPGVSEENARSEMEQTWKDTLDAAKAKPEALDNTLLKLAAVSDNPKLQVTSLKNTLTQDANTILSVGGNITDRQVSSLGIMQKLMATPQGMHALSEYVGNDNAKKVAAFINSDTDPNDPKALETTRSWIKNGYGAVASTDEKKAAVSFISSQDDGWFMRIAKVLPFTGQPGELNPYGLNASSKQMIAQDLAGPLAQTRKAFPGLTNEQAAQMAFRQYYGDPKNADMVDGTFVRSNHMLMGGTQSLFQGVQKLFNGPISQGSDNYQQAAKEASRAALKSAVQSEVDRFNSTNPEHPEDMAHFRDDDYVAVGGDQMYGGSLMLHYLNKATGTMLPVVLTPKAVYEKYGAGLDRVRANRNVDDSAPTPLPFGGT